MTAVPFEMIDEPTTYRYDIFSCDCRPITSIRDGPYDIRNFFKHGNDDCRSIIRDGMGPMTYGIPSNMAMTAVPLQEMPYDLRNSFKHGNDCRAP